MRTGVLLSGLSALVLASTVVCNSNQFSENTDTLLYLNHSDTARYVGIYRCRQCHADIYESFIQTGMGQSFDSASRKKSAAVFSGHDVVYDRYRDFYYQPFWVNNTFYIKEYRLKGKDTVYSHIEKVDYIIGSGQHTNSHLMSTNGYFTQMPLTFYSQKGKWDLPPGFSEGNNARFDRKIELECMSCHNAYPDFVNGSTNKFRSVPRGIDCERCHGPGSIHVQQKQAGIRVDTATAIDYSIVNPKKLPYDLQVEVCQRCHLQGNAVLKPGKSFYDFKPGKKLSEYMDVFMPQYSDQQEFIMASHAERLKSSTCFLQSTARSIQVKTKTYTNSKLVNKDLGSLTCISCHDPHRSVKVTKDEQFNTACKNCHTNPNAWKLPECSAKMAIRKVNGDNCWKCHMPKSGAIDIPHVRVTDHKIQIPVSADKKAAVKRFLGLKAINNPHPTDLSMAEAYLNYVEKFANNPSYLDSAKYYLQKDKSASPYAFSLQIRLAYLKGDPAGILQLAKESNPEEVKHAWTCYRIGEAAFYQQDPDLAGLWFKKACELAPYQLDFMVKYAIVQAEGGQKKEARKLLEKVLSENPKHVSAMANLGYLCLSEGLAKEAIDWYDKALALDPDDEEALLNKAGFYLFVKQNLKAKALLEQLLEKHPENQRARQILADLS